jgi:levanbiose-producing levanase
VAGQALTSLVFPPPGHREARLAADAGVQLKGGTVTALAGIRQPSS